MGNIRVVDTIWAGYDGFLESEKKIAKYIMENRIEVLNMTISELSEACNTSNASVSRFCRKIGMDSFHHFKIALARDEVDEGVKYESSNKISINDIEGSLNNILSNKVEELTATINMMDSDELEEIISSLMNAQNVQVMAIGNTIPVAMDLAFKLNELGIKTSAGPVWEGQFAYTLNLGKNDMLIAISNSGESKKVFEAVKVAKKNGAKTVGITNNIKSAIGKEVDYHIQTATREKLFLDEICFSRISAATVVEILFLFLVNEIKDSHTRISRAEESYADVKL